jgi:hypothetical protein
LDLDAPHDAYQMPELKAKVDIEEDTPEPLVTIVGATIAAIRPLVADPGGFPAGFIVDTHSGSVGIANSADDLVVGSWPDSDKWVAAGIASG